MPARILAILSVLLTSCALLAGQTSDWRPREMRPQVLGEFVAKCETDLKQARGAESGQASATPNVGGGGAPDSVTVDPTDTVRKALGMECALPTIDGEYLVLETTPRGGTLRNWFPARTDQRADDVTKLLGLRDQLCARGFLSRVYAQQVQSGRVVPRPPLSAKMVSGTSHADAVEAFHKAFANDLAKTIPISLFMVASQMTALNAIQSEDDAIKEGFRWLGPVENSPPPPNVLKGSGLRARALARITADPLAPSNPTLRDAAEALAGGRPVRIEGDDIWIIASDAKTLLQASLNRLTAAPQTSRDHLLTLITGACREPVDQGARDGKISEEQVASLIEHTGRWLMVIDSAKADKPDQINYCWLGVGAPEAWGFRPDSRTKAPLTGAASAPLAAVDDLRRDVDPPPSDRKPAASYDDLFKGPVEPRPEVARAREEAMQRAEELSRTLAAEKSAVKLDLKHASETGLSRAAAETLADQINAMADATEARRASGVDQPFAGGADRAEQEVKNLRGAAKDLATAAAKGMASAKEVRGAIKKALGKGDGDGSGDNGGGGSRGGGGGMFSFSAPLLDLVLKASGFDALAQQLTMVVAAMNPGLMQDLLSAVERLSDKGRFLNDLARKAMPLADLYKKYGAALNTFNTCLDRLQSEGIDRLLKQLEGELVSKLKNEWADDLINRAAGVLPEPYRRYASDALTTARGLPPNTTPSQLAAVLRDKVVKEVRPVVINRAKELVPAQLHGAINLLHSINCWDPAQGFPSDLPQRVQKALQVQATNLLKSEAEKFANETLGLNLSADRLSEIWDSDEAKAQAAVRGLANEVSEAALKKTINEVPGMPEDLREMVRTTILNNGLDPNAYVINGEAARNGAERLIKKACAKAETRAVERINQELGRSGVRVDALKNLRDIAGDPRLLARRLGIDPTAIEAVMDANPKELATQVAALAKQVDETVANMLSQGGIDAALRNGSREAQHAVKEFARGRNFSLPQDMDPTTALESLGRMSIVELLPKDIRDLDLGSLPARLKAAGMCGAVPGIEVINTQDFSEYLNKKMAIAVPASVLQNVLDGKRGAEAAWAEAQVTANLLQKTVGVSAEDLLRDPAGVSAAALEAMARKRLDQLRAETAPLLQAAGQHCDAAKDKVKTVAELIKESREGLAKAAGAQVLLVSTLLAVAQADETSLKEEYRALKGHWEALGNAEGNEVKQAALDGLRALGLELDRAAIDNAIAKNDPARLAAIVRAGLLENLPRGENVGGVPTELERAMRGEFDEVKNYVQDALITPAQLKTAQVMGCTDGDLTHATNGDWTKLVKTYRTKFSPSVTLEDVTCVTSNIVTPLKTAAKGALTSARPGRVSEDAWNNMVASTEQAFTEDDLKAWILGRMDSNAEHIKYAQSPSLSGTVKRMREQIERMKLAPGRDPTETLKLLQPGVQQAID